MRVFYFGCHGEAGHYFWMPNMRHAWNAVNAVPWGYSTDGGLCPGAVVDANGNRRSSRAEVDGEAALHHKSGWTALAFWDRSVDERPASNSVFLAEGTFSFEEMVALAKEQFPQVWERLTFPVRLASELAVTP